MSKVTWNVNDELRHLRASLENAYTNEQFVAGTVKKIERELAKPSRIALGVFVNGLNNLSIYEGLCGTVKVLEDDSSGWQHVARSHLLKSWSLRIRVAMGLPNSSWVDLNNGALTLAFSIAIEADATATWCGQLLIEDWRTSDGRFVGWDVTSFPMAMMSAFAFWRGIDLEVAEQLGVYEDALLTDDQLGSAFVEMCQYHCGRVSDRTDDEYVEFEHSPFDVFPAEILAMLRIRKELGLPTPHIDHPLLNTRLASPPLPLPTVQYQLLNDVVNFVQNELEISPMDRSE